jgi:hypothetical protein
MSYLQAVLFSENVSADDDDIDRLFSQLEQIEPPTSLVDSILASVTKLGQQKRQGSKDIWVQTYELITHNEDQEPS